MSPFFWKPEYSVGCSEIDKQHQQLFALAAELHRAMLEAQGNDVLADLLNRLVDYIIYHFSSEERQMRHFAYPEYEQHLQQHAELTEQALGYQRQVLGGKIAASVAVMLSLSQSFKAHIQHSDQKLGAHLRARCRGSSAA